MPPPLADFVTLRRFRRYYFSLFFAAAFADAADITVYAVIYAVVFASPHIRFAAAILSIIAVLFRATGFLSRSMSFARRAYFDDAFRCLPPQPYGAR